MFARGSGGGGVSLGEGRRSFGFPEGGVAGEIDAGQAGKGHLVIDEGEVAGGPLIARVFGKNCSCSIDMWQVLRRAGVRIQLMRSMHANWSMSVSFEIRTGSTGHLAGGRKVVTPSLCL